MELIIYISPTQYTKGVIMMDGSLTSVISDFENTLKYDPSSHVIVSMTRVMHAFYNSIQFNMDKLQIPLEYQEKDIMFVQGLIAWLPGIKDCFSVNREF